MRKARMLRDRELRRRRQPPRGPFRSVVVHGDVAFDVVHDPKRVLPGP